MSGKAGGGAQGRLEDLRGTLHVQSFVRAFVVEDIHELVEALMLLHTSGYKYSPQTQRI
jgi:hypothetical protein